MRKVLECYKGFKDVKRLVDIGGGLGANIHLITSKYPHIHGINFDLPRVIQHAPPYSGMAFYMFSIIMREVSNIYHVSMLVMFNITNG